MTRILGLCALLFAIVMTPLALAQQFGGAQVGPGASYNATVANYLYGPKLATANLSGCSTGGTPSLVGSTTASLVTAGTTASTTCTITWPATRSVAPNCAITGHTSAAGAPFITVESTTVLTWTFTSAASTVWDVLCFGDNT